MLTIMYDDDDDDNEWRQPVFLKVFFWSDNKKAETGNWSQQAGYCEAESQSSVENLMMIMMMVMVIVMVMKRS